MSYAHYKKKEKKITPLSQGSASTPTPQPPSIAVHTPSNLACQHKERNV